MAVEDISYAVNKLLETLATDSPNLTPSDMTAIKLAIAGEGRLVLREVCCETCRHFTPWKYYDGEIMWECGGKGYLDPPKQPCEHWQDQGGE